jgi:hypothetical protein
VRRGGGGMLLLVRGYSGVCLNLTLPLFPEEKGER